MARRNAPSLSMMAPASTCARCALVCWRRPPTARCVSPCSVSRQMVGGGPGCSRRTPRGRTFGAPPRSWRGTGPAGVVPSAVGGWSATVGEGGGPRGPKASEWLGGHCGGRGLLWRKNLRRGLRQAPGAFSERAAPDLNQPSRPHSALYSPFASTKPWRHGCTPAHLLSLSLTIPLSLTRAYWPASMASSSSRGSSSRNTTDLNNLNGSHRGGVLAGLDGILELARKLQQELEAAQEPPHTHQPVDLRPLSRQRAVDHLPPRPPGRGRGEGEVWVRGGEV